ncbi:MAG: HAD-IIIA family hydrolase [Candidatus Aenigmarchaeota archaeon]|nr:HAD-IIIA family hydrolase [Candidatus Aenigmarchaeota archaeon]
MKIKAVLFDLDGVLVNSPYFIWKSHNMAARKLGYPTCKKEALYKLIGMKWDDVIVSLIPQADVELFKKTANEFLKKMYGKIKLLGKANHTLKKLKSHGIKIGIVSGSNRKYADEVLKAVKLNIKLIDIRVHAEDTKMHKPHPEPILLALKKLDIAPQEAIYVGDSLLDFKAAKSAGVNFIGSLSGVTKAEEFLSSNVVYLVKDVSELPKYFEDRNFMFVRKTVAVIVKFQEKILLLKRSKRVATYPNQWSVVHGRIEDGESIEKRAIKEVKEETCLDTRVLRKGKKIIYIDENLGITWHMFPVLVEAKNDKVKLNWENAAYKWVKPEEIKNYNKYLEVFESFLGDKNAYNKSK